MSADKGLEISSSDAIGGVDSGQVNKDGVKHSPIVLDKDRIAIRLDPLDAKYPPIVIPKVNPSDPDVFARYGNRLDLIKDDPDGKSDIQAMSRAADERRRQREEELRAMERVSEERRREREDAFFRKEIKDKSTF